MTRHEKLCEALGLPLDSSEHTINYVLQAERRFHQALKNDTHQDWFEKLMADIIKSPEN